MVSLLCFLAPSYRIEHKLGKKPALLPLNRQAYEMGLKLGEEQR